MDEEPGPKPKLKFPLFLIVILSIFVLLGIIIGLSFIFPDINIFNSFNSKVIVSSLFSSENPSNSRCQVYAEQFGINNSSDCEGTDKEKCLALCTAHFECCKN